MDLADILHARPDGSFVVNAKTGPYHVTADADPELHAEAARLVGTKKLPDEKLPIDKPSIPTRPVPTIEDLQIRLDALAADLDALRRKG